jgi:hypothetical protein
MTNEEIAAYQAAQKKFRESEIGQLYWRHHNALINYWRNDMNDRISDRKLHDLDDACRKAQDEFIGRLMADYGVV